MKSVLRSVAILLAAFFLAVLAISAQGTMDERKLLILWAILALAIHLLLSARRKRSTKQDSG